MIAITGTSAQFGTDRMRVKMRIIGMLRITSMMLATNNEAIRPQTMSGCCWNSSGPGVMLYNDSAPIITAVVPEPGTPRVSIGTSAPQAEAPMAVSGAARPRFLALAEVPAGPGDALLVQLAHGAGQRRPGTRQHAHDEPQQAATDV